MGIILKIKNISDVITNSSSEVFIVKTEKPNKSIKDNILNFHKNVSWYGMYSIEDLPQGLKWIISDDMVELLKENADSSSGMGGDCEVFNWEDGLKEYQQWSNKPNATLNDFARYLKKSVDEVESVILIDIDWACKGTINMLKDKYNASLCDDEYDFWYDAFKYGRKL